MKRARELETKVEDEPPAKRARTEAEARDDFEDAEAEVKTEDAEAEVKTEDVQFPADWMLALRIAVEGKRSMYIGGVSACGKSTLARAIKMVMEKLGKRVQTLTHAKSTAALVGGVTLHAFICKTPKKKSTSIVNEGDDNKSSDARLDRLLKSIKANVDKDPYGKKATAIRDVDVLILDEAQAMDVVDFRALNGIIRHVCDSKLPFAGKQVIVLADVLGGLSAITNKAGEAFFKTTTFRDVDWVKLHLTHNMRARGDPAFAKMVARVLEGHALYDDMTQLLARRVDAIPDDGIWSTVVKSSEKEVAKLSQAMQVKFSGDVPYTFDTDITRCEEKASTLKLFMSAKNSLGEQFQGPREITLYIGSQVMLICDSDRSDGRIPSGTHGCVVGFERGPGNKDFPVVKFMGRKPRLICYKIMKKHTELYGMVYCRRLPLKLAYAVKTYELQGIGIGQITFDPNKSMRKYAPFLLTRVSSLDELFMVKAPEDEDEAVQRAAFTKMFRPDASTYGFYQQCAREKQDITAVTLPHRTEKVLQEVLQTPDAFMTPTMYVPSDAVSHEEFERLLTMRQKERKAKARDPDASRRAKLRQKKQARVDGFEDESHLAYSALGDLATVPDSFGSKDEKLS